MDVFAVLNRLEYWRKRVIWRSIIFLFGLPIAGLFALPYAPVHWRTLCFAVVYYSISITGVTAGYHRLWAHRSYEAKPILRLYLALAGASAAQGSIRWWSRDHRAHHRFTDTDKDPYGVQNGLWHAHIGWLLVRRSKRHLARTDLSDLDNDPIVVWQHRHFMLILLCTAFAFPVLFCWLGWGDWRGGCAYACLLRLFFVHQSTFCVNSLAHWLGEQPYDDHMSPKDHILTAIVTFGEGYHNFHHEFPCDYRSAPAWYHYDPTKWYIFILSCVGLAHNLKVFRSETIARRKLRQLQKIINRELNHLGALALNELPIMEWDEFQHQVMQGQQWTVITGIVHDISGFVDKHPGGKALMLSALGKDATSRFQGGVYQHSTTAHNLLSDMRVAILRGGLELDKH